MNISKSDSNYCPLLILQKNYLWYSLFTRLYKLKIFFSIIKKRTFRKNKNSKNFNKRVNTKHDILGKLLVAYELEYGMFNSRVFDQNIQAQNAKPQIHYLIQSNNPYVL